MEITRRPKLAPTTQIVVEKEQQKAEQKKQEAPASSAAPVASGADFARQRPALPDLPVVDVVGVRASKSFPDGQKFIAQRLAEIEQLTKLGVPVTVVFDLDNTVFDTRHRTLHALQDFDQQNGTTWFSGVTVADVKIDGATTAASLATSLGIPASVVEAAGQHWKTAFWTPSNLTHDVAIDAMVDLIKRTQDAGADVRFLTGRTQPFHQASLDQLRKAGVDVADADVFCKPDVSTLTAPFKEQKLKEWAQRAELGFFVTEGVRDLEHVHGVLPDVPLLRLDCSFEDGAKLKNVPLWPAAF